MLGKGVRSALFYVFILAPMSGCSSSPLPILSDLDLPAPDLPHAIRIVDAVDHPSNFIETALSTCDKRTAAGETACVKRSLQEAKTALPALIKLLPGCRQGQVCHYTYTTNDRVGLLAATSHFVVNWRVDVDLTHPAKTVDAIPITVTQV